MMNVRTENAYLHGDCIQGETVSSYKKQFLKTSITSNGPFDQGLTVSDELITVEERKCKGCPGCYLIGKTQWFKKPNRDLIRVFWSPEFKHLRDLAKHVAEQSGFEMNSYFVGHWRIVYHLQRVALRYLFEEIKRARHALDSDTLTVVLQECYLEPTEEWRTETEANLSEMDYSKDAQVRSIVNNLKRDFNLCQFLFEVIGQSKFS